MSSSGEIRFLGGVASSSVSLSNAHFVGTGNVRIYTPSNIDSTSQSVKFNIMASTTNFTGSYNSVIFTLSANTQASFSGTLSGGKHFSFINLSLSSNSTKFFQKPLLFFSDATVYFSPLQHKSNPPTLHNPPHTPASAHSQGKSRLQFINCTIHKPSKIR